MDNLAIQIEEEIERGNNLFIKIFDRLLTISGSLVGGGLILFISNFKVNLLDTGLDLKLIGITLSLYLLSFFLALFGEIISPFLFYKGAEYKVYKTNQYKKSFHTTKIIISCSLVISFFLLSLGIVLSIFVLMPLFSK